MFNKANIGYHCWIINKTKLKIVVDDLHLSLQPQSTIDILDCHHSMLTIQQVEASLNSSILSDLYNKKMIAFRMTQPQKDISRKIDISKLSIPTKNRTNIKMEQKRFKELEIDINEDDFALQNSNDSVLEHSGKTNLREQSNNEPSFIEDEQSIKR